MDIHRWLAEAVKSAILSAQKSGDLASFEIPEITVERPREASFGDYSSPVALRLARQARMAPIQIAQHIVDHMSNYDYVAEVTASKPGFVNFRLASDWLQQTVDIIIAAGHDAGGSNIGNGKKVQIECVSANPTGPIALHRSRGGVMGDTLARAFKATGHNVELEYYYNDAGRQITLLGESLRIRYLQELGTAADLSDEHYQGDYVVDLARSLVADRGDELVDSPVGVFSEFAVDHIKAGQRASLNRVNIVFDVFFREQSLYEDGKVDDALERLRDRGYVYEKDGAQWFRTTDFGDDKDRVIVRSNGQPTYRLPDIAYHMDKAQRGFEQVVDIFGPDHHATAPQVLMGVEALGYDPTIMRTILHQIVSLVRGGEQIKMSTRRGIFVTLDELVEEVGADPIRYFMVSRSGNSHIEFDLNLAVEKSDKNPVYYIQNAHVRCAGIFRKWAEAGYEPDADTNADLSLLTHKKELAFLRKALELTEVLETMVDTCEPHHIAFYAYDLASAFHQVYEQCRVLHSEVPESLRLSRLRFYRSAKVLFARVLDLMGMSAPEVM